MSKFMIEQEILGRLSHLISLPADEFRFEYFEYGGCAACTIDENQTQTARWMCKAKAS